MSWWRRLGLIGIWTALSVVVASIYGVLNNQITFSLSPEYFSLILLPGFEVELWRWGMEAIPMRLQAAFLGVLTTWWVGLFGGLLLGMVGSLGRRPPVATRAILLAIFRVVLAAFFASALSGTAAYLAEPKWNPSPQDWPILFGVQNPRRVLAAEIWHVAAYFGGAAGTLWSAVALGRKRTRQRSQ